MDTAELYESVLTCLGRVRDDEHLRRSGLVSALAMAANQLSSPPVNLESVLATLRTAQGEAVASTASTDLLEGLARAYNQALGCAPQDELPRLGGWASEGRQTATWAAPRCQVLPVARLAPEPGQRAPEAPAPLAIADLLEAASRRSESVQVDAAVGLAEPRTVTLETVVHHALDNIALLARHRSERRMRERAYEEQRILECADAIVATGDIAQGAITRWWLEARESPNPWKHWAPFFVLANSDDAEAFVRLHHEFDGLPCTVSQVDVLSDALVCSSRADVLRFAEAAASDPRPLCRAVAIDLLSRRSPDDESVLWPHLHDVNHVVLHTAVRAAHRLRKPSAKLVDLIVRYLGVRDRQVAWQVARTLLLWHRPEPYHAVRNRLPLATTLGPLVLDVLVLAGGADDLAELEPLLQQCAPTPALFDALARVGNAEVWSFLLHHLADGELAPAVANALETLFGMLVPNEDRLSVEAWHASISRANLPSQVRLRRGRAWSPPGVVEECTAVHTLTRFEVERRLDELVTRVGGAAGVDLGPFLPHSGPLLEGTLRRYAAASYRTGSWDVAPG